LKTLVLLLSVFSVNTIFSQTSTARFLYWQPSAEIRALGGAGVSIVGNSYSAYYNPASFAFDTTLNFSASFTQPFSDFKNMSHSFISASLPIKKIGTFAISLNAFWIENQVVTSEADPEPLGLILENPELFSPTHWQLKLSYAYNINNNIALGVNLGLLSVTLTNRPIGESDFTGTSFAFLLDGGVLIKDILSEATYLDVNPIQNWWIDNTSHSGFSFGFSLLNIGSKIRYVDPDYKEPPPSLALFGLTYWPIFTNQISDRILIDYEKKIYDSYKYDLVHFGNEIILFKLVSLRGGYVLSTGDVQDNYFTYGLGAKTKYFSVNIARYNQFIRTSWHFDARLTLEL
jgi:hypothetical protein